MESYLVNCMLHTASILSPMSICVIAAPFVWNVLLQNLHQMVLSGSQDFSERTSLSTLSEVAYPFLDSSIFLYAISLLF